MSVLLFFIILSALVIVHELGHFLAARAFGIRVDEFGLGYPPRAKSLFTWRGTLFTLNWLPFGGFVKIFGEDYEESELERAKSGHVPQGYPKTLEEQVPTQRKQDSFQNKNRGIQAIVLVAGVFFNFLFAWVLISLGLVSGLPAPAGLSFSVENPQTMITVVLPDSPAAEAGLKSGDAILSINTVPVSPEAASLVIAESAGTLDFEVARGDKITHHLVTPREGIISGQKAVGISMELIGIAKLPFHQAIWEGGKITWALTKATAVALGGFIAQAVTGRADLSSVTGPVGLVGMVGDARELGLGYLLSFTALISLNLSIINLLPFPALDGGRLFFVGIEALTRRKVPARIFNAVNAVGFAVLIFLMLLITAHDVRVIF